MKAVSPHDFGLYLLAMLVCGVLIGYMATTLLWRPQATQQLNAAARYLLECNQQVAPASLCDTPPQ